MEGQTVRPQISPCPPLPAPAPNKPLHAKKITHAVSMLTAKQERNLRFWAEACEQHRSAGIEDAMHELGYASPATVHRYLQLLIDQGLMVKAGGSRSYQPTRAGWALLGRSPPEEGVPILGDIAAGLPILAIENHAGHLSDIRPSEGRIALRVRGDSMIGEHIFDGDYALIDTKRPVQNQDIAAILLEEEATLKRVHFHNQGLRLEAANPAYAPIEVNGQSLGDSCRLVGPLHMIVRLPGAPT